MGSGCWFPQPTGTLRKPRPPQALSRRQPHPWQSQGQDTPEQAGKGPSDLRPPPFPEPHPSPRQPGSQGGLGSLGLPSQLSVFIFSFF